MRKRERIPRGERIAILTLGIAIAVLITVRYYHFSQGEQGDTSTDFEPFEKEIADFERDTLTAPTTPKKRTPTSRKKAAPKPPETLEWQLDPVEYETAP